MCFPKLHKVLETRGTPYTPTLLHFALLPVHRMIQCRHRWSIVKTTHFAMSYTELQVRSSTHPISCCWPHNTVVTWSTGPWHITSSPNSYTRTQQPHAPEFTLSHGVHVLASHSLLHRLQVGKGAHSCMPSCRPWLPRFLASFQFLQIPSLNPHTILIFLFIS